MAVTVLGSQGYQDLTSSGRLLFTFVNGSQLVLILANLGAGAAGAALDTATTAGGGVKSIQMLLEAS